MASNYQAFEDDDGALRRLEPHWNKGMIFASIAVSLLGAFTSTQLYVCFLPESTNVHHVCAATNGICRMCQARTSVYFSSVLIWKLMSSLTFGFCSIWSLHFVAMLACELDLPIGISVPLTILSSILAVLFTFAALAFDLLWETYRHGKWQRLEVRKASNKRGGNPAWRHKKSRSHAEFNEEEDGDTYENEEHLENIGLLQESSLDTGLITPPHTDSGSDPSLHNLTHTTNTDPTQKTVGFSPSLSATQLSESSSDVSESRRSSIAGSAHSSHGLANIVNLANRSSTQAKHAFVLTGEALYMG